VCQAQVKDWSKIVIAYEPVIFICNICLWMINCWQFLR
jgi:hypothetical protein